MGMVLDTVFDTRLNQILITSLGKLVSYDADGDGDFDVEDAKVLLGKCIDFNYFIARIYIFLHG